MRGNSKWGSFWS